MKKAILLIAVIASISCTRAQQKGFSETALAEKLIGEDGSQILFNDILKKNLGKPLVIEVWASWCSDCVKAMPRAKSMQRKHSKSAFIFISMDKTDKKWKEGIKKHELSGEQYLSPDGMKGKFGTAIDLDWIPRYIIVSKNGDVIMYRGIETDFDQMDMILNRLEL